MSEPTPTINTWAVYRRLLPYVRPYLLRLSIGILAGALAGGSLYGLLRLSPNLIAPFEQSAAAPAPAAAAAAATAAAEEEEIEEGAEGKADVPEAVDAARLASMAQRFGIRVMREDGRMTWQFMSLGLLALPLFVILRAGANYLNHYAMRWVGARVVRDVRDELFVGLQGQSLQFFGRTDVGQLISRCTNDTNVIDTILPITIADVSRAPMEILSATLFVVRFSMSGSLFSLVALMFLAFPLCVIPIVLLGRCVRTHTHRALEGVSVLVTRMHETFTCIRIVKAFHTERRETERFRVMNRGYFGSVIRALRAELLMTPLMEGVATLLVVTFFVTCYARDVKLQQIIPIGLAAVVAYRPIRQLARMNANLQRGAAALQRIYALMDTREVLAEAPDPVRVDAFEEGVRFEDVTFAYDRGGTPALSDVNVQMPVGSVTAVVGETGSGKTTLANLLARFYDPTAGRVLLDGRDLRELEIASLRRLIGVVTQETILFNDTIANNIAYGTKDATHEQIVEAARQANAHAFIVQDPAGYERVVGEKGFVLSGGERQRIAIARAILKNPPILILDEATSALDTVTERLVQEAIARVMEHRTVLAIAHRLSTVRHADQILLLDRGRIQERGTHQSLYEAGGRYRRLCDMQVLDG